MESHGQAAIPRNRETKGSERDREAEGTGRKGETESPERTAISRYRHEFSAGGIFFSVLEDGGGLR